MSRFLSYPNAKLLHSGSKNCYLIHANSQDVFYTIELCDKSINFTTYSTISPLYSIKESLLRLLAIAALLSEDYSIEIEGLFPYLIHVLSKSEPSAREIHGDNVLNPQVVLSKRIVELLSINQKLKSDAESLSKTVASATSQLILSKYSFNSNPKQISSETGIDPAHITSAISSLKQSGNRLIYNKNGNFDIVRI